MTAGVGNRKTTATFWEHFHHVADIGIRGYGVTLEKAFEQTALALTAVITDPAVVSPVEQVEITCTAPDSELLLADWLNGVIYEMACRTMLFGRYEVHIDNLRLTGRAWGESVDVKKHMPAVEVKGATYTALKVNRRKDGLWVAQCVVDV